MFNREDEDENENDGLDEIKSILSNSEEKESRKTALIKNANLFFDEISKNPVLLKDKRVPVEQKKTLLENMIQLFVETEEYEKCGTIQSWKKLVK
jgi:hypothetical protein